MQAPISFHNLIGQPRNECRLLGCDTLLVTPNVVPSLMIPFTLKMEPTPCFEMSVLTTFTLRLIPEDGILHSHGCENLKYYNLEMTM
jgi:hypothetical protein